MAERTTPNDGALNWPLEAARRHADASCWGHPGSNLCLDFHGDPVRAQLVVFSDGNHHMALADCARGFVESNPGVEDLFYATTPPAVLTGLLGGGRLQLGNLCLSRRPHVFIGPEEILAGLHAAGRTGVPTAFAQSLGNVLLVAGGNPLGITGVADLLRAEVRPFISNPHTETASYRVYLDTLLGLAAGCGIAPDALARRLAPGSASVVFGERIHHREAPAAIAAGRADVAPVYHHLALRYTRIFPGRFDSVALAGAPPPGAQPPAMVITRYSVAPTAQPGPWGEAFVEFMCGPRAAKIYRAHGLAPGG